MPRTRSVWSPISWDCNFCNDQLVLDDQRRSGILWCFRWGDTLRTSGKPSSGWCQWSHGLLHEPPLIKLVMIFMLLMMMMVMIISKRPWSGRAYLKIGLWEALSCNILNNLNQIVDKDNDDHDEVGCTPRTMFREWKKYSHQDIVSSRDQHSTRAADSSLTNMIFLYKFEPTFKSTPALAGLQEQYLHQNWHCLPIKSRLMKIKSQCVDVGQWLPQEKAKRTSI